MAFNSFLNNFTSNSKSINTLKSTTTRCVAQVFSFADSRRDQESPDQAPGELPRENSEGRKVSNVDIANNTLADQLRFKKKISQVNPMTTSEIVIDDAIVACTIGKSKGVASSTFELTLLPTEEFDHILFRGDWIIISLADAKDINLEEGKGRKLVGIIDRVHRNKVTIGEGAISITYTVSGGGFGRILETAEMYFNPYTDKRIQSIQLQIFGMKKFGSPIDFLNFYLDLFLGNTKTENGFDKMIFAQLLPPQVYQKLNGDGREKGSEVAFYDILNLEFDDSAGEGYCHFRDIVTVGSGSLWNTLLQASNDAINELYTDLRDGKPTLVFRKQPLSKTRQKEFLSQATQDARKVPEYLIVNDNLGTSLDEHFNYITLFPIDSILQDKVFLFAALSPQEFPQINIDNIKKFGLKRLEKYTEYSWQAGTASQLDNGLLRTWINELSEYWNDYWRCQNGTIEIIGRDDFEIGEFYSIPERDIAFQVEGVQWNWEYQQAIITTLNVTHGMRTDGSYVDENPPPGRVGATNFRRSK